MLRAISRGPAAMPARHFCPYAQGIKTSARGMASVATDIERRAAPVASKTASDKKHLRVNVRLSGIDHSVLDSYVELLRRTAVEMGLPCTGRIPLPTKREKYTLLKSPHVSKQHRQQFARITHHRLLQVYNASDVTLNTYLKLLEMECPEGVIVTLTEHHAEQLPEKLRQSLVAGKV